MRDGALVIHGHRYPIVVLPGIERIPLDTLRKLEDFVRGGGILVATRRLPSLAPGLLHREETVQVQALVKRLFEGPAHFIPDEDRSLGPKLASLRRPDVIISPAAPDVGFVHRRTDTADIYYIANTGNTARAFRANFRVSGARAEWWDPSDGKRTPARLLGQSQGGADVAFDLEPYGSRLLVFSNDAAAPGPIPAPPVSLPSPLDLTDGWQVAFEDAGQAVRMDRLRSWTELDGLRHYSGRAIYRKEISVPRTFLRAGARVKLNFGEPVPVPVKPDEGERAWVEGPVREAAEVRVNGRRAGSVWRPPYEADVTGLVQTGANRIEVVVANLLVNKIAGLPRPGGTLAERLSFYKALNKRYGVRFHPENLENLQPLPAGLFGPVRLQAAW